ncbi:hypothetical protein PoB_003067400 [Plakobranchus ocellatus]|uniref:Uncharacterized protein n=1 Tax=Plakobranchus ocellatus TaxID=259542 RepID=A0AAV4AD68_9GAST|nr:hypothetical protein PoB_003067400 [Plakobranchus ocellatus]
MGIKSNWKNMVSSTSSKTWAVTANHDQHSKTSSARATVEAASAMTEERRRQQQLQENMLQQEENMGSSNNSNRKGSSSSIIIWADSVAKRGHSSRKWTAQQNE